MRALVLVAHPDTTSLCHAAAARAVTGLERAGHDVDVIDLYGQRYRAAMSHEELAHDCDDQVIPIGESRRLRDALAGRPGLRYTEFTMFKHLDPSKVRLPLVALMRELVKFYRSVYPVFRRSVST